MACPVAPATLSDGTGHVGRRWNPMASMPTNPPARKAHDHLGGAVDVLRPAVDAVEDHRLQRGQHAAGDQQGVLALAEEQRHVLQLLVVQGGHQRRGRADGVPVAGRVLLRELQAGPDRRGKRLPQAARGGQRRGHPLGQPFAGPPGDRLDQPLAIAEVVVDERTRDARGVGDLLEGDAGRVAPVEHRGGGVDQEGPPLLAGQPRPRAVGAGLLGHPGCPRGREWEAGSARRPVASPPGARSRR